ncbi:MAG: crossover junction endodeoxyribonuclease RuvC [Deltaproteobacteria bacterium]|nr:crossover junction endodeoxyribonuclease RuvC [Deltaproteobacteria bacterium]
MRILGIDPGSIRTGFATISIQKNSIELISCGTILLDDDKPLAQRLVQLDQDLKLIIGKTKPEQLAIESLFFAKNAQSALKLGHARGVILRRAAEHSLEIFEYTPAHIKSVVGGSGRAKKDQLARLLRFYLKLPKNYEFPSEDASDALAIAFAHAQTETKVKTGEPKPSKAVKQKNDRSSFWQTSL